MRRIIAVIFCLLSLSFSANSQSPQGINYQGVAYNAGVPVTNQSVGVRLTILDGSSTGTVVYQETQTPTTDNTGLFSIVIGNGIVVSGTFSSIIWSNGLKWLQTEIDITGGTNYQVIGNSQFMSVPYSFHSNTSNFSFGSFAIPDGFSNAVTVPLATNVPYTVPVGKTLYVPTAMGGLAVGADTLWTALGSGGSDAKTMIGVGENSIVNSFRGSMLCFLVDKTVDWLTFDLVNVPLVVPAGKVFVIVNSAALSSQLPACQVTLNGVPYNFYFISLTNAVISEGNTLSTMGCAVLGSKIVVNGYFKDR